MHCSRALFRFVVIAIIVLVNHVVGDIRDVLLGPRPSTMVADGNLKERRRELLELEVDRE